MDGHITNERPKTPTPANEGDTFVGWVYIINPDEHQLQPQEREVIDKAHEYYKDMHLYLSYHMNPERNTIAILNSGSLQLLKSTEVPQNKIPDALKELLEAVGTKTEAWDQVRDMWVPVPVKSEEKKA